MTKSDIMQVTKGGTVSLGRRFADKERGFTMPEIIIVMVIVSVLSAIAIPNAIHQLQLYRLDSSVSAIGSKLMETRINAIKRNRTCWLRIDKTAKTAQIRSDSPAGVFDIGYPTNMAQGTDLVAPGWIEVAFDSMGRYSSGPQTVTLLEVDSTRKKDVTISPAGKISVGAMY